MAGLRFPVFCMKHNWNIWQMKTAFEIETGKTEPEKTKNEKRMEIGVNIFSCE